jgi:hypothetical protein
MIATKPQLINFTKLTNDCKTVIGNFKMIIELTKKDIDSLKAKQNLNDKERKELSMLLIDQVHISNELEAKQLLYNEYILRCNELEQIEKEEKADYITCKAIILKQAYQYRDNQKILPELRNHLKEVLKQPQKHFNLDQKIAFHLALKKEVELCKNYLHSIFPH